MDSNFNLSNSKLNHLLNFSKEPSSHSTLKQPHIGLMTHQYNSNLQSIESVKSSRSIVSKKLVNFKQKHSLQSKKQLQSSGVTCSFREKSKDYSNQIRERNLKQSSNKGGSSYEILQRGDFFQVVPSKTKFDCTTHRSSSNRSMQEKENRKRNISGFAERRTKIVGKPKNYKHQNKQLSKSQEGTQKRLGSPREEQDDEQYNELVDVINHMAEYQVKFQKTLQNKEHQYSQLLHTISDGQLVQKEGFQLQDQLSEIQRYRLDSGVVSLQIKPCALTFSDWVLRRQAEIQNQRLNQRVQCLMAMNSSILQQLKGSHSEQWLSSLQDYNKSSSLTEDISSILASEEASHSQRMEWQSESYLKERVNQLEEEVFEMRKVKNSLELKVRTIQRKAESDISSYKKKLAMQIWNWREKYTKLQYENSRLRKIKQQTMSMQLSKDD